MKKTIETTAPMRCRPGVLAPLGLGIALALGTGTAGAATAWTNGQDATQALGGSYDDPFGPENPIFGSPSDVCVDGTNEKVYVVDRGAHRVLRFTAAEAARKEGTPEAVFGQPTLTNTTPNTGGRSASTLDGPTVCAIDSAGRLYVVDANNRRVLRYDSAWSKTTGAAAANAVLGQSSFTAFETGAAPNRFGPIYTYESGGWSQMTGIALGPGGELYVADGPNHRVLRFNNAGTMLSGANASGVLGVSNFSSAGAGSTTRSTFNGILGLAVDAAGNLYVSEGRNRRILRFNNAAGKTGLVDADGVLGRADYTSVTPNGTAIAADNLSTDVTDMEVLPDGSLYIVDTAFNRVLVYDDPAGKANGAPADHVLGRVDFTGDSDHGSTAKGELAWPVGLGYNPQTNTLLVADAYNGRVVGHVLLVPPTASNVAISGTPAQGQALTGTYTYTGGDGGSTPGASTFQWRRDGSDITGATASTYTPVAADAGQTLTFCVTPVSPGGAAGAQVCSQPTATVPANAAPTASGVAISGTATVGQQLTGSYTYADAEGDPQGASTFQWKRGGSDIAGANGSTYTPVAADVGHTLAFCVTPVTSAGALGAQQCSQPTAAVPANAAPTASGVAISGTATVGQQLTGSYTYADAEGDPQGASTFQWKRGGSDIAGANGSAYLLVAADAGQALTFCVTPVTSAGAQGAEACSSPTAAVALAPVAGVCGTAASQAQAVAPTANLCSAGTPGTLASSGGQYTWACQGANGGSNSSCQAPWASTGGGAVPTGTVELRAGNNWQLDSASFSPALPQGASAPAANAVFPAGLLSLDLSAGDVGSEATVIVRFTQPVPSGAVYMKYGPSPVGYSCTDAAQCALPHWYELPASRAELAVDRMSVTLKLTDGGLGDHDGQANRLIKDPGGFMVRGAAAGAQAIPTLSEWGVLLLSALAAAFGLRAVRRRV
ncbi:IPTL-CTERM sorting domain-containing protein [Acidovorax sp. MR-S7]|uniref:IPTL-CTERM sorting domain-containing protein n=1 Tax=Acidovorax sp. MR-S7 TaxID=1268622 RepID=UPI00036BBE66|nr:IPTL-CTERM sorting domain-containing protein [Acidovorax sp. MR-S7]GAD22908.1 hypothetical protein AVS7_02668 [Acidovorax sp. MR-S7]